LVRTLSGPLFGGMSRCCAKPQLALVGMSPFARRVVARKLQTMLTQVRCDAPKWGLRHRDDFQNEQENPP
jgi:hypothetical protein